MQSLAEVNDSRDFENAAHVAVHKRFTEALPVILGRLKDFPRQQGDLAEICYGLDTAQAVPQARKWFASADNNTRFWSALILLRHGDRSKFEGLAELEAALVKDDGSYLYPRAIDPLLATNYDKAAALACGILKKERFEMHGFSTGQILQRLFLAGRQECLDYLLRRLDSEKSAGTTSGTHNGKQVARRRSRATEPPKSWPSGEATGRNTTRSHPTMTAARSASNLRAG